LRKGQISTADLRSEFRRDPALPILIGDSSFTRGIQNGVERGEYVYRYRGLVFGPGDPYTGINILDDAFVFTMTYAREHGIWPRPKPVTPEPPLFRGPTGPVTQFPSTAGTVPEPFEPGITTPAQPSSTTAGPDSFTHEGVLREALRILWEKTRAAGVKQIQLLTIRPFERVDAFKMLAIVGGISGAKIKVEFEGEYGTQAGGEFHFTFQGPVEDALPVKDFLGPQYRAAVDPGLVATFTLNFAKGLSLEGDATDKLTERLTQQSMGTAYVTASAEAQP
jgi:hypothetical protein